MVMALAAAPATPLSAAALASPLRSMNLGSAVAARMPRITMASISSIIVKPRWRFLMSKLREGWWGWIQGTWEPLALPIGQPGVARDIGASLCSLERHAAEIPQREKNAQCQHQHHGAEKQDQDQIDLLR